MKLKNSKIEALHNELDERDANFPRRYESDEVVAHVRRRIKPKISFNGLLTKVHLFFIRRSEDYGFSFFFCDLSLKTFLTYS